MLWKLNCLPLPYTKEGSDVITACDRREFTPDKGPYEATYENAWAELHRHFYNYSFRASLLFHVALFKVKV